MATTVCPHCRKRIHHKATVCPYCTSNISPTSFWLTGQGLLIIIMAIVFGFVSMVRAEDGFEIKEVSVKSLGPVPAQGYVEATILIDVENDNIPGRIYVELRGISWDGYEILRYNFLEEFNKDERKKITDTRTFKAESFLKVRDWEVKSAKKYLYRK